MCIMLLTCTEYIGFFTVILVFRSVSPVTGNCDACAGRHDDEVVISLWTCLLRIYESVDYEPRRLRGLMELFIILSATAPEL